MITIDGSQGEGGGQILRSSLALACCLQTPFRMEHIRANRRKPGLMHQHLTAVQAAAQITRARVTGAALGSRTLTFIPGEVICGDYEFSIGTAGSCMLVLQTILPPLMLAKGPSRLALEGGTHNPHAPPFDFVNTAFLPLLSRMGPEVSLKLTRYGFYPAGGGLVEVSIQPATPLRPIDISSRGAIVRRSASAIVSSLPKSIAEREIATLQKHAHWHDAPMQVQSVTNAYGPGNIVMAMIECEQVTELFCAFGEKGLKAERVAKRVATMVNDYLNSNAAIGRHLADQLLLPFALAGGGSFTTLAPTQHTHTNCSVIKTFIDVDMGVERIDKTDYRIAVNT